MGLSSILLVLSFGLLLHVSGGSGAPPEPAAVELDIFSGRPNPTWKLSGEETSRFLGLLRELPSTEPGWFDAGLGYRGFAVSFQDAQGRETRVQIFKGIVKRSVGEFTEYFVDKDRKLERWVLKTGDSRLSPELYEMAAKELM
ncbi:MAG TPA: hypothetical protein VF789_15605 [Thermoanaerobaculia bacterium]